MAVMNSREKTGITCYVKKMKGMKKKGGVTQVVKRAQPSMTLFSVRREGCNCLPAPGHPCLLFCLNDSLTVCEGSRTSLEQITTSQILVHPLLDSFFCAAGQPVQTSRALLLQEF